MINVSFNQINCVHIGKLSEWWGSYPLCAICGEKLKDGDLVDGHFPHMDAYNRCQGHKNIPIDDDREYEYLRNEEKNNE